ncbi:primosomal protein N' [Nocardioides marmoribigeumensis]|uniref:Probable replication restart protein PriA n=1 Tax=Nocardioides marmoribigeumensis TaxID=433649 RepID=A0ABU2BQS1_9ACTN|nr:primosomal protein N' [Nocardioides marmoribigeumensis]MDR7360983.1 primosomal protein N' (replication factor Y) [Nocardioides marmoribigeumensis]
MPEEPDPRTPPAGEQLDLLPELARARAEAAEQTERTRAKDQARGPDPAPERPVARVLVDVPLAHLDKPFDYLVTADLHDQAVPGCRVKVRFAGQEVGGFLLERVAESDHPGRLAPLRKVVSPEPVLHPEVARLSLLVAERYAGTRSDVLRLAIPPRHARVEKEERRPAADPAAPLDPSPLWEHYPPGLLEGLREGRSPRAVWSVLPGDDPMRGLADAVAATVASGRGALLCVPDHRDLARADAALGEVLGVGRHVVLSADLGPAARYRAFLALSRGDVRVAVGTRAAAYAPVHDLGLVTLWDDGDDLFAEPRAPYPHTREVLLVRAHEAGAGALLAATSRSVEAAVLVETGWAHDLTAHRDLRRSLAPRVSVTGATDKEVERDPFARTTRLPTSAHRAIAEGLAHGPVLVQTPRSGYAPALVCSTCRTPARCAHCQGPLEQPRSQADLTCRWCGTEVPEHRCPVCGQGSLRAVVLGERRTAEELGRSFPGTTVRRSSADRVLDEVEDAPVLVVATPGAEPPARGGYTTVVLLDTWLVLARPDLRTEEEALRRWANAAALARPAGEGGHVVLVGDPALPVVQALVRWDPAGFAGRTAQERREAHLPPGARMAVLTGSPDDLADALGRLRLPPGADVLGPVPDQDGAERVVVRVPRRAGPALSEALRAVSGVRAARKLPPVRVQVDPWSLG